MSDKPKKATDILLENQKELADIRAIVENYENNSKLIVNSVNILVQKIDAMESNLLNFIRSNNNLSQQTNITPTQEQTQEQAHVQTRTHLPGIKPGVVLNINDQKVVNDEVLHNDEKTEEVEQIEVATQQVGRRRGDRTPEDNTVAGKLPIKQKVLYKDGKNVCLANIEIFAYAEQGKLELLHKCRTNSAGRWSALLPSGSFLVKIQKSGTNVRPSFDAAYTINIPDNVTPPVELEPYQENS